MTELRYYAFLRAINTGNRRLTNQQLLAPFLGLGFTDVAAYQAAGNVTFRAAATTSVDEQRIEEAVAESYGFDAPTFVRSTIELRSIAARHPFTPDELAASEGRVQVAFLRNTPPVDAIAEAMSLVPSEDRATVIEREWYWLPVAGVGASKVPVGRIEALLGEMTMRTLGTVARMVSRFDE